jgi:hypothetical protein
VHGKRSAVNEEWRSDTAIMSSSASTSSSPLAGLQIFMNKQIIIVPQPI